MEGALAALSDYLAEANLVLQRVVDRHSNDIEHGEENENFLIFSDNRQAFSMVERILRQCVGILSEEGCKTTSIAQAALANQEFHQALSRIASLGRCKHLATYDVLRGDISLVKWEPLLTPSYAVLYFVTISLPDDDNLLRENHAGKGYHYHYADAKQRRSNVLLTFSNAERENSPAVTWEHHAEGKAAFKARVERTSCRAAA